MSEEDSSEISTHPASSVVRKHLPSIPDSTTQLTTLSHCLDRQLSNPRADHGYGPFFLEYSLMSEYNLVHRQKMPGIYVVPSSKSPLAWNGVIFVRQGIYQDGVFRFTVHIPDNYPDCECPSVIFDHPVFHPVINPVTGQLDVLRAFHKWRRNVNHIWQVLLYTRRIFFKVETKATLNAKASLLYETDIEQFKVKVAECIKVCKETLLEDPDPADEYAIRFTELDPLTHSEVKKQMFQEKDENKEEINKSIQNIGLSWIALGSMDIFSKDNLNAT